MFAVLTLLLVVVTHVYLYRRAVHDVFDGRRARRIGATVIVLLGLAVAAAFTTQRALDPGAARPLHTAGYLWLAVVLYATWVLVVGELVRLGLRAAGRAPTRNDAASSPGCSRGRRPSSRSGR
ncbi:hypothetical protein ACFQV8_33255 [Pseudonocardia benzenivorans]